MTTARKSRPKDISILAIFILCVAGWNGLRLGETIFFWYTLKAYGAQPLYIFVSGGTWLITGLVLARSLWLGKDWGWMATICVTPVYVTWYWLDRLILQQPHANWPFVVTLHMMFLITIVIILFSKSTRLYFRRDVYER